MISSDKYLCNMCIYICTQQQKLRVIEQGKHISSSLLTCKVHNPQSITTFNNTLHSNGNFMNNNVPNSTFVCEHPEKSRESMIVSGVRVFTVHILFYRTWF